MHLRVVKVRRHDTERRYVQLVESFRRPDGVPAHKLLASLGDLPELTLGNLKVALAASRQGRALVLPDAPPTSTGPMTVRANLRYLDLAVALHVWRASRLGDLLGSLLPQGQETLGPADVLTALVLQRCVAPRSKRYAQHWLPTTALPELLGIAPERFTNTRIHRLLDALDHVTDTLQARLPEVLLAEQKPGFGALFLDVTDVHFEGRGPQLAAYTRTKDGHPRRRCVGVVLLCDEGGRPLRWHVVAATRHDGDVMGAMVDELAACPWVQQAPVVCDRAMGQSKALARLHARKVRFLTAVPVSEIESTTDAIPLGPFRALALGGTDETRERDHALAVQAAERAGFLPVDASTYVLDLGVRSRLRPLPEFDPRDEAALPVEEEDDDEEQEAAWPRAVVAEAAPRPEPSGLRGAAAVLAEAKALRAQLASGAYRSAAALARAVGISQARLSQTFALLRLTADLQEELESGRAPEVSERQVRPLVRMNAEEQRIAFAALQARPPRPQRLPVTKRRQPTTSESRPEPPRQRMVVYFNPTMCLDQRARATRHVAEIEAFVAGLNARLEQPRSRRTADEVERQVRRALERRKVRRWYRVEVSTDEVSKRHRVRCTLDEEAWRKRRQYDGLVVLVGHAELPQQTGAELVHLYRAKDAVEKDFQTIKGVVKLRPIFHHTDPKVRAHVTLCMLALLLNRLVERALVGSALKTAAMAWEVLGTCHLNQLTSHPALGPLYTVTTPTTAQQALLRHLGLRKLAEDREVAATLVPR